MKGNTTALRMFCLVACVEAKDNKHMEHVHGTVPFDWVVECHGGSWGSHMRCHGVNHWTKFKAQARVVHLLKFISDVQ